MTDKTPVASITKDENKRINRLYYKILGPEGEPEIVAELERKFELRTMVKRTQDGAVDAHATMANCGAYEVLSWIKQRIKFGEQGK